MKDRKNPIIIGIVLTVACLLLTGMIFVSYDRTYHYQVTDVSQTSRYTGDVSGDFRIDWNDVTALQNLCGKQDVTQWDLECADLNQDGCISREDTALLLRYLSVSDAWTLRGIDAYCKAFRNGQG
ncbi:MAG: hypothetical protein IJJ69_02675 [Oscillospiraceae bacterium]|nr:hypothetical protein [Oscillospiraceae bacterium]